MSPNTPMLSIDRTDPSTSQDPSASTSVFDPVSSVSSAVPSSVFNATLPLSAHPNPTLQPNAPILGTAGSAHVASALFSAPTSANPVNASPTQALPTSTRLKPRAKTDDADRIVLEYLRKRGFKAIENAFQQKLTSTNPAHLSPRDLALEEADVDGDLRNVIMLLRNPAELAESDVRRFEDSFCELRDWVDGSLDVYKPQLHALLYPLLVHCFLEMVRRDHGEDARAFLARCSPEFSNGALVDGQASRRDELVALQSITSPQHLEENDTALLFLNNRYEIHLSYYAFELIVAFLVEDQRRTVLLRILNQRCRVRVDTPVDGTGLGAAGSVGRDKDDEQKMPGFIADEERTILLSSDVLWGRLTPSHFMIPDEGEAKGQKTKAKDKAKPGADGKGKGDGPKRDGQQGDEDDEPTTREDGTINKSKVPLKKFRVGAPGLETDADRANRADLSVKNAVEGVRRDLAVMCYTFTNTKDDGLNCCSVTDDGSQIAAGFGDSTVRVWDAKASGTAGSDAGGLAGRPLRLVGHSGPVYSVDWTPCSRYVLSGSEDGTARLWCTNLKTDLVAYRGHNYPIWSAEFSPLGHYFATGSHDRTGRVWCTDRLYPLRILAGHLADVDAVKWHPNCNYLATGSSDRTTRLWDVREGKCVRVMTGTSTVHALAFSPDGKTLACGGDSGVIDIWDITGGKRMQQLKGHRSTVWSMNYSRGGAVLASGGADWRVCVWRAEDWSKIVPDVEGMGAVGSGGAGAKADRGATGNEANGTDGDGDTVMGDGANGKASGAENEDGKKNGAAEGEDAAQDGEKDDGGRDGNEEGSDVEEIEENESELVPLLETFDTKETPVHAVKFTRRNVLVACGPFGS